VPESMCCRTFRATGVTAYLQRGSTLEKAQQIACHESPRTTKLYDRSSDTLMRYPIVIETGETGDYSAYAPDVPGVIVTGATREEVMANMEQALQLHLVNDEKPEPSAIVYVEVP
jgi:predicted RNase H-like HicB family nuclease